KIIQTDSSDQIILDYYKSTRTRQDSSKTNSAVSVPVYEGSVNTITCVTVFAVALLIVIYILNKIRVHCKSKLNAHNIKFYLLFQSKSVLDMLPLIKILCPIEDLGCCIGDQIHNIRIEHYWQPILTFQWNLQFNNKLSKHIFQ